jgi:hypothetical protein
MIVEHSPAVLHQPLYKTHLIFDDSRRGSLGRDTFGQNVRFSRRLSVEEWGQYARVHIWNSIKNQTVNFLDTAILKLRYELIDTTPVV